MDAAERRLTKVALVAMLVCTMPVAAYAEVAEAALTYISPGDSFDNATLIAPGTYANAQPLYLSHFFKLLLSRGTILAAMLQPRPEGDIDLYLYDGFREGVANSSARERGVTEMSQLVAEVTGYYYVEVRFVLGQSNYTLTVDASLLSVVAADWGTASSPLDAAPGDLGMPLRVGVRNENSFTITDVSATLHLGGTFTSASGGATAVAHHSLPVQPTQSFDLVFTLSLGSSTAIGINFLTMTVTYYSEAETSTNASLPFNLTVPIHVPGRAILQFALSDLFLQPSTTTTLVLAVRNLGTAPAGSCELTLTVPSPLALAGTGNRWSLGTILPGHEATVPISLYAPASTQGNTFQVTAALAYRSPTGLSRAETQTLAVNVLDEAQYAHVHGVAVDEEGGGLSDVEVQVYASGGALVAGTRTRSDGFFSLALKFGTYNLHLEKPGYTEALKTIAVQESDTDIGIIELRRTLRLSASTLSLIASPGDSISIPFTVGNTGEEAEAVGFLISKPQDWSARALDQSSEVTKAYVSAGQSLTFQLEVTVPLTAVVGLNYTVSLTAVGTTNPSLTFTVQVRGQPTATVSGRIIDEYDNGMEEAEINAYSPDGALVRSATTSSDGSFAIELPIATAIALHFSKAGYVNVTRSVSLKSPGEKVELGEIVLLKAIRLYSSTLSLTASPGGKLLFPFVVSNIGGESEMVEFLIRSPERWSARVLGQVDYVISKAGLSSGASLNLQLEVWIPLTSAGDNNLTLTSVGGTNSSLDFAIKVLPSRETMISCELPGKSGAPGDTFRFQVRVSNPVDVEQRFSISVNPISPGWTASIKSISGEAVAEVTLGGSEFVDLIVDVSTPPSVSEGNYSLLFTAKSPDMSEGLPLLLIVQRPTTGIKLRATPPYLDVYAGSEGRFKLTLSNVGGYDELLNLTAEGLPQGLRAWFEDAGRQEITKVYVEAGQLKEFYTFVSTPKGAGLGARTFMVSVVSASVSETVPLALNVLGLYEIRITNVNFYTSLNVGGEATFSLKVRNNGTQEVTNVKAGLTGSVPDGFTVSVEPASMYSLKADEEATFDIIVNTESDVNAGNYYVDFNVWSDQAESQSFTLRVEVVQEVSWMIYGGVLIVIAVVGLFLVYRRFGRR